MRGYLAGMDRALKDRRPDEDGRNAVCIHTRRFFGVCEIGERRIGGETQRNSENRASLSSVEREPTDLDRSGWGPGGRRFKSCLPDQGESPAQAGLSALWSRRVQAAMGSNGVNCESMQRSHISPSPESTYQISPTVR